MIYDKKRNEQRLTGKKNILLNNRTMEIKNLKREIKRIRNKKIFLKDTQENLRVKRV